jgi:hypothetical protein
MSWLKGRRHLLDVPKVKTVRDDPQGDVDMRLLLLSDGTDASGAHFSRIMLPFSGQDGVLRTADSMSCTLL